MDTVLDWTETLIDATKTGYQKLSDKSKLWVKTAFPSIGMAN